MTMGTGIVRWAQASQVVDVYVGAADARAQHLDQHVVDAHAGHWHIFEPEPAFGALRFTNAFIRNSLSLFVEMTVDDIWDDSRTASRLCSSTMQYTPPASDCGRDADGVSSERCVRRSVVGRSRNAPDSGPDGAAD